MSTDDVTFLLAFTCLAAAFLLVVVK